MRWQPNVQATVAVYRPTAAAIITIHHHQKLHSMTLLHAPEVNCKTFHLARDHHQVQQSTVIEHAPFSVLFSVLKVMFV